MNRRQFLKVSGLSSALFMALASPATLKLLRSQSQADASGKLFRGTQDGKIYQSADQGRSWKLHTNLGEQFSVRGFSEGRDGKLYAHVAFQASEFDLELTDNAKYWVSVL